MSLGLAVALTVVSLYLLLIGLALWDVRKWGLHGPRSRSGAPSAPPQPASPAAPDTSTVPG